MQFFSEVVFIDLFFSISQYLLSTCEGHTQCDAITLEKIFDTCCFSYFSLYRGHANAILSVMRFFSKVFFTDLFFFLIQYLQRTCDGHDQCDAITLEKSIFFLLFLLLQFSQRTSKRQTQSDAIFLKSIFQNFFLKNSFFSEKIQYIQRT